MVTVFGRRIRLFRPRSIWIRRVVQWFFFLLIALIAINHTLAESGAAIPLLSSASLHVVCPFGNHHAVKDRRAVANSRLAAKDIFNGNRRVVEDKPPRSAPRVPINP